MEIDFSHILDYIPHRYPFLLIDKVVDVKPNVSAVGIKAVTSNEHYFQGHFPNHPVMPGVLIIESMAQTSAVLVVHSLGSAFEGKLVYFMSIDGAKFRRTVVPGDLLSIRVKVVQNRTMVWRLECQAFVDDNLCAEATVTAMIRDSQHYHAHKTAQISRMAKIGKNVKIGAFSVIGDQVEIGDNTNIHEHVIIKGRTKIGKNCEIFPFASLGTKPQDLKYQGEESEIIIGDNNQIREYVTINPGTMGGGMLTRIGNHCLFMMGSHVAHDCIIGNHVILANNATLAGHVIVGDNAILGGLSAVQQFVKIGKGAMIGGLTGVAGDVIPNGMVIGPRGTLHGINHLGLKRRNYSKEEVKKLNKFCRQVFFGKMGTVKSRMDEINLDGELVAEIREFLALSHKNGLIEPHKNHADEE